MLKNKLYPYIEKYINEYLWGFTKEQLDVGVMNGTIILDKLNIRVDKVNEKLDSLEIPFWLKAGLIRKISISCSLMNFIGEKPLEVTIEDIEVIVAPSFKWIIKNLNSFIEENEYHIKEPYDPTDNNSHDIFNRKVNIYDSSILKQKQKIIELFTDKTKLSLFLNKMFTKCVKFYYQKSYLINAKINNIHVRFEDDQLINILSNVAFGVKVKSFDVNLSAEGIMKKNNFKCDTAHLYWEPNPKIFIPSKLYLDNLDKESNINEGYYNYLKTINFKHIGGDIKHIVENFNFMGNFGLQVIETGSLDFFAKAREKNIKFYTQIATSELNLHVFPEFVRTIENLFVFMRSFYIIDPLQDFKPMRKPYKRNADLTKKNSNDPKFKHKRKMIVRDWLYYLVWFNRFKKAIYGKVKNSITAEFSQYYNICCIPNTNIINELENKNVNDSIYLKKDKDKDNSILFQGQDEKEGELNPENINIHVTGELLFKGVNVKIYEGIGMKESSRFILFKLFGVENKIYLSKEKFDFVFNTKTVTVLNSNLIATDKVKDDYQRLEYTNAHNDSYTSDAISQLKEETSSKNTTMTHLTNNKINKKLNIVNEILIKKFSSIPNFDTQHDVISNYGTKLANAQQLYPHHRGSYIDTGRKRSIVSLVLADHQEEENEKKHSLIYSKSINEYNKTLQKKKFFNVNTQADKPLKVLEKVNFNLLEIQPHGTSHCLSFKLIKSSSKNQGDSFNLLLGSIRFNIFEEYIIQLLEILGKFNPILNKIKTSKTEKWWKVPKVVKVQKEIFLMRNFIYKKLASSPESQRSNEANEYMKLMKCEIEKFDSNLNKFELNYIMSVIANKDFELNTNYSDCTLLLYGSSHDEVASKGRTKLPPLGLKISLSKRKLSVKLFDLELEYTDIENLKETLSAIVKIAKEKIKTIGVILLPVIRRLNQESKILLSKKKSIETTNNVKIVENNVKKEKQIPFIENFPCVDSKNTSLIELNNINMKYDYKIPKPQEDVKLMKTLENQSDSREVFEMQNSSMDISGLDFNEMDKEKMVQNFKKE